MEKLVIAVLMALFLACAVGYTPQPECNLCKAQLEKCRQSNLELKKQLEGCEKELIDLQLEITDIRERSNSYYSRYLSFQRLYNNIKKDYDSFRAYNSKQNIDYERMLNASKAREMQLRRDLDTCCG